MLASTIPSVSRMGEANLQQQRIMNYELRIMN